MSLTVKIVPNQKKPEHLSFEDDDEIFLDLEKSFIDLDDFVEYY